MKSELLKQEQHSQVLFISTDFQFKSKLGEQ